MTGVGIDVGASRLHLVSVAGGRVAGAAVLDAGDPEGAVRWAVEAGATRVAIDAPSALSTAPHAGDRALGRKFRAARCGEVALGRDEGVWVPWVSPPVGAADVAGWITVGLALFEACETAGVVAVETFPHACFRVLAGGVRVPAKSTPAGIAARAALLTAAGVTERSLPFWTHDGLDAAVAALVAASPDARRVGCGHDASAIWLPAASVAERC
jgi:hypothetical protein